MPYETQKYRNTRHRHSSSLSSQSKDVSLGELTCIQEVSSLRKLSKSYLVPKSYLKQLAQRSDRVRKFIRRRTGASVSPHILIDNLDRVGTKADADHIVGESSQAQPELPNSNIAEGDTELRDRFSDCTLHAPDSKGIPLSVSKTAASLSQRRLASNRPTLTRLLPLPPVPLFEAPTVPSQDIVSSKARKLHLQLLTDARIALDNAQPITPVDQVLSERSSPPDAPRQVVRNKKRTSLLTSLLSQSLDSLGEDVSSPYPTTPVEEQLPSPVDPCERNPITCHRKESHTFEETESPSAAFDSAPPSVGSRPSIRKLLVNIPRRLSYSRPVMAAPSPLSLDPSTSAYLASPLLLHTPRFSPALSPRDSLSSPAIVDAPNYFGTQ